MSEIIIYSTPNNITCKNLEQAMDTITSGLHQDFYSSIENLSQRLCQPLGPDVIGIFIASNPQELFELASIQHLFRNIRIILILPDREDSTISQGFSLRPRYLSYADGDLFDVAAVMGKMVSRTYH